MEDPLFAKQNDPFFMEALSQGMDPENPITSVQINFKDPSLNFMFKSFLFRDFSSVSSIAHIHKSLTNVYTKLEKSGIYKKINVKFEPGPQPNTMRVTFDPEKKSRVSGSFDHQIDNSGSFVQEGKLTIRNPLGLLDQLSIDASKGWGGNFLESAHLKYSLPIFYKDYSMEISLEKSFKDLIPTLKEETSAKILTFFNAHRYFRFSDTFKVNNFDFYKHSREVFEHELFPCRRFAVKAGRIWDTRYEIGKEYGQRSELSGEIGIGTERDTYAKFEFHNHSFINPKDFEYIKKVKNINFENYFSLGLTLPLSKGKLRMNDRFFTYNTRGFSEVGNIENPYDQNLHSSAGTQGFERLGEYLGDDIFIKNTFKVNLNRFPFLAEGGVVPFVYGSWVYLSGNYMNKRNANMNLNFMENVKQHSRFSAGVGFAKGFGPVKLEILLNLAAKGKVSDRFARFQLRIASLD